MDPWLQAAQLVGVPAVILAAIGLGLFRAAHWLAPRVDRLVSGHLEFLEKTTAIQADIQSLVEALREHGAELASQQTARFDALDLTLARVDSGLDRLRQQS